MPVSGWGAEVRTCPTRRVCKLQGAAHPGSWGAGFPRLMWEQIGLVLSTLLLPSQFPGTLNPWRDRFKAQGCKLGSRQGSFPHCSLLPKAREAHLSGACLCSPGDEAVRKLLRLKSFSVRATPAFLPARGGGGRTLAEPAPPGPSLHVSPSSPRREGLAAAPAPPAPPRPGGRGASLAAVAPPPKSSRYPCAGSPGKQGRDPS